MSNCLDNKCRLCKNLVISTGVSIVSVDGINTLVIDIPENFYPNGMRICLVIAQTIPTDATISTPVAISIGGNTATVYPLVRCDCTPVTACALRTRRKYPLRVSTTATSAVFKSLGGLSCTPDNVLSAIPVTDSTEGVVATSSIQEGGTSRTVSKTVTTKTVVKSE